MLIDFFLNEFLFSCNLNLQQTPSYMEATLGQQIPVNARIMDSANLSTETPPPGYMSEDGDPMDQNDNMSESLLVSYNFNRILLFSKYIYVYIYIRIDCQG